MCILVPGRPTALTSCTANETRPTRPSPRAPASQSTWLPRPPSAPSAPTHWRWSPTEEEAVVRCSRPTCATAAPTTMASRAFHQSTRYGPPPPLSPAIPAALGAPAGHRLAKVEMGEVKIAKENQQRLHKYIYIYKTIKQS